MTVCIAALCEMENNPKIVVSSDRMVTTGIIPRIEYEHTGSKITPIKYSNEFIAIGLGSGIISFIESFFQKLHWQIGEYVRSVREDHRQDIFEIMPISQVAQLGVNVYKEILWETINRQVLSPLGFSLSDLKVKEGEKSIHPQVIEPILRAIEKRDL